MDQATLVVEQIDEGAKITEELRSQNIDVVAAFWMKASEDGHWYFYIASPIVDQLGFAKAYRKVHGALRNLLPNIWVDLFQIKLIAEHNPIACDVINVQNRYPGQLPIRFEGSHLGNVTIDQAYIYPGASASKS